MADTFAPWLPDFCRRSRISAIFGMAEMVVVVVALWPSQGSRLTFGQFVSTSAFALWLALAVAVMLCMCRRMLAPFRPVVGILLSLFLAAAISVGAAGIVYALFTALGSPPVNVEFWRFVSASAAIAVLITASALRYFYVSDRWAAQLNANARAKADALQARIRPHFLFNSMNLIASLVRVNPVVAEQAVLDLSDLFRAALGANDGLSTLAQETDLARSYLSIESLRMGDRLQVDWQLVEPLPWSLGLPHLILQPLVENAVVHGISRLPAGGTVEIAIWVEDGLLHLRVRNPAPDPTAPFLTLQSGSGHAQQSIKYRLEYLFKSRARMVQGWQNGFYACELGVPLS